MQWFQAKNQKDPMQSPHTRSPMGQDCCGSIHIVRQGINHTRQLLFWFHWSKGAERKHLNNSRWTDQRTVQQILYGVCVLLIVFYNREGVMILLPYMAYVSVTKFCNKGLLLSTTWHVPLSNTCEANSVCHSLLSDFFCSPSTYFLTYISACTNLFRFTFSN